MAERPANYVLASPSAPNATIAVQPNATIDLGNSLKQITVKLTLSNTPSVPPFNNIQILIAYDTHALTAASLDYSTNVFTQTSYPTYVVRDCLDGHAANNGASGLCGGDDGPGFTSFAESILGGTTPVGTQGDIFSLTFNVNTTAPHFSQIQIASAIMGNGQKDPNTGQIIQILPPTLDGYYTSKKCGAIACAPASASFTWSPQPPKQGAVTIFYGNASRPSPGQSINDYSWKFGDTYGTRPYRDTGANSTASYLYQVSGTYSVTLTINDTAGIIVSKTIQVVVINADKIIGIESLDIQPSAIGVLPGEVFTIKAVLRNFGGVTVNASMTLTLATVQPKLLGSLPLASMKPSATRTLTVTWDSKGYVPNVYRMDASTPILINQTKTDNNNKSVWVLLVVPAGGGLSLLGTAGIAVVAVGAGGYGVSFLRKRNLNPDDAL